MTEPQDISFEGQLLALLPALRRFARSLAQSDSEGEDLLQDGIVAALSRRAQWRGLNLRSWMLAIISNRYRNSRRSHGRHPTAPLDAALDVPAPQAEPDPLGRMRLEAALNSLSQDQRMVLMLVVIEGMPYQEVADLLQIPLGTVMSRLSRARQKISDTMAAENVVPLRRQT